MEYSSDSDRTKVGERISNALRALYPASAAKSIARDAQASQRTAETWLDGTATPSLLHFARLIGKHPELFKVLQPVVIWAEAAVASIECDALEAQRVEKRAKAAEARAKLRSLR